MTFPAITVRTTGTPVTALRMKAVPVPVCARAATVAFRPDGKLPEDRHDRTSAPGRIRCPACHWQPDRKSRWYCMSMGAPEHFNAGCGHGWNTFDTGGLCPGCFYQWKHTTCLSCTVTSMHADWYTQGSTGQGSVP